MLVYIVHLEVVIALVPGASGSGGDAIKTGFTAFFYSLRTVALPFVLIFNTELLLIDVGWLQGILVAVSATIAILIFTAGIMGWFLTRNRIYESVALILIAFALFRPDFFMNRIAPPFARIEPAQLEQAVGDAAPGSSLRIEVADPDFDTGNMTETTVVLTIGDEADGAARTEALDLIPLEEDGLVKLDEPLFGTPVPDELSNFDYYADEPVRITTVQAPQSQPPKELIFIPAFVLLGLIAFLQRNRASRQEGVTP